MIKRLLVLVTLLVMGVNALFASFESGVKLYTLSTKYFDIIYSDSSKDTALYISTFADETFESINAVLQSKHDERFTLVVTGEIEEANGYATVVPSYTTIHVFNAIPPLEWSVGNCYNFFKTEFLHELVHAISLNMRSDFLSGLSKVFGNWYHGQSAMPMFMVEGITVKWESEEGYGRLNNPLVREQIMQDIIDGEFKTMAQASANADFYQHRSTFYHYGGHFSLYLEKKYGKEKYTELWKAVGEATVNILPAPFLLSGNFVWLPALAAQQLLGFGLAFQQVYGVSAESEWELFKESMRFKGEVKTNPNNLTDTKLDSDSYQLVGNKIYYYDNFDCAVKSYDLKEKTESIVLEGEGITSIALSKDGSKMLVNRTFNQSRKNGIVKLLVQTYELGKKTFTGEKWTSIRGASYFNDDIVAIKLRKHFTDIVLIKKNGEEKTLIKGNELLYFDMPKQLNSSEIVFLAMDKGRMKIGKYNLDKDEATFIDGDIQYIRNLNVYEDKIVFAYNNDQSFYKMGIIDGNTMTLQTDNYSGGVFFPMIQGDDIYYMAKFAKGNLLMQYGEKLSSFGGVKKAFKVAKLDIEPDRTQEIAQMKIEEKDYNPMGYLLPHAWMPILGFPNDTFVGIGAGNLPFVNAPDAAGILLYMKDPLGMNTLRLTATYNWSKSFGNILFSWENTALPVHFELTAWDMLVSYNTTYYRRSGASLDLSHTLSFLELNQYLKLGISGTYGQIDFEDSGVVNTSPYTWNDRYTTSVTATAYSKLALYTMYHPYRYYDAMRGVYSSLWFDYGILNQVMQAELAVEIYPYVLPMVVRLSAGFSPTNVFTSAGGNHIMGIAEFGNDLTESAYYAGVELDYQILGFEIQSGLDAILPIFFNRLTFSLGYRGQLLGNNYNHSAFLRANLTVPLLGGSGGFAAYKAIFFAEGYYAINGGGTYDFNLNKAGYRLGVDFGKQFMDE